MSDRLDEFVLGRVLGSGLTAVVREGRLEDGRTFALKIFKSEAVQGVFANMQNERFEFLAVSQIIHDRVVRYHDLRENRQLIKADGTTSIVHYVVQDLINGGELFDFIQANGGFPEEICKHFFVQMLLGLHAIHSSGFSHRDLKPENILLDLNNDIKIVDFGFCCPMEGKNGDGFSRTQLGTLQYMAPEIWDNQGYQAHCVDIFSLGVILFQMRTASSPFNSAEPADKYWNLLATYRSDKFWTAHCKMQGQDDYFNEEFKDLVTSMLMKDPAERLCISGIVGHPWLQGAATQDYVNQVFNERRAAMEQRALQN